MVQEPLFCPTGIGWSPVSRIPPLLGARACKVAVTKLREGRKINSNPEKGAVGMGLDISPTNRSTNPAGSAAARHIG